MSFVLNNVLTKETKTASFSADQQITKDDTF